MEELLKPEGVIIHQEIKDASGPGSGSGIYNNYGIEKEVLDRLFTSKDEEISALKEEIKYLREKVDQLLNK